MDHTVSIIGAGYVGLTTAVLFSNAGLKTYLVDIDPKKIELIRNKKSPFFEPGLDDLIAKAIDGGQLSATTDYSAAIPKSDLVFSCVGTPDKADGSSNLNYIFQAAEAVAGLAKNGLVFVQKSTVPVGTGQAVMAAIAKKAPALKFSYVSNPEFLREGTAISDSLQPDRTVLGGSEENALEQVAAAYKKLEEAAGKIDSSLPASSTEPALIFTTLESAELIKVTANAFLALKISFANSIAKLCDATGADINGVMDGIGKDRRIGRAFLNAGRGYGGGCFPKDVSGLIASAAENNTEMEIMNAAVHVNNSMPHFIVDKLENSHGPLNAKKIAFLGLSFKAGTSDTRRSPAIALANLLAAKGAKVRAYDPQAVIEEGHDLDDSIIREKSAEQALKEADIAVLATDWPEFIDLDFVKVKGLLNGNLIVDAMNALDSRAVKNSGLIYLGVGR